MKMITVPKAYPDDEKIEQFFRAFLISRESKAKIEMDDSDGYKNKRQFYKHLKRVSQKFEYYNTLRVIRTLSGIYLFRIF